MYGQILADGTPKNKKIKMKKLVHLALLIIIAALSFTSCKKFLDKEPLSAATDENFWKNEKEANSAVAVIMPCFAKLLPMAMPSLIMVIIPVTNSGHHLVAKIGRK